MTEQAKCCGNCWWWIKYRSQEGGWCYRDGTDMLADEGCAQWERYRTTRDKYRVNGPPGELGEVDHGG